VATIVATVITMATVIAVGAVIIEKEVAAGNPLDHGEFLKLISQPVDPEGETLHGRVLVHIMMRLDVEGLSNTYKLAEGAPEQLGVNLLSSKSGSSSASLVAGSFPFSNFFRRWLSSSSSSLRPRFDGGGLLNAISSFSR
jgi:hypothetical protein